MVRSAPRKKKKITGAFPHFTFKVALSRATAPVDRNGAEDGNGEEEGTDTGDAEKREEEDCSCPSQAATVRNGRKCHVRYEESAHSLRSLWRPSAATDERTPHAPAVMDITAGPERDMPGVATGRPEKKRLTRAQRAQRAAPENVTTWGKVKMERVPESVT
ncbi:hypothetical protein NDU88_007080 [Pleurodeles waltl]|uniref:Uncharacterized protein n=1 Tax=Pleurodeles waltl TaxID=8319 RepID=A0AAV7UMV7_PLEWA|nr:hypothetical protein NDU88_007080 [Pleurodeles waltl]